MSQRNDIAAKVRLLIDGTEIPDLVWVGDLDVEQQMIEVPEFNTIRNIGNGVTKIPVIPAKYKITKGGSALAFFRNWYYNKETHDVTVVHTDASGTEISRDLAPGAWCAKFKQPEYDAASPKYAQFETLMVPFDFTPMDALA